MGMSVSISAATAADAEQLLKLQFLCYQQEALLYDDYTIDPLTQTLDSLRAELDTGSALVARLGTEIVASVRGRLDDDGVAHLNRLIVHPRMQRHGLGTRLLRAMERQLAAQAGGTPAAYRLFTGHRSVGNLRLYQRLGYEPVQTREVSRRLRIVTLERRTDTNAPLVASA